MAITSTTMKNRPKPTSETNQSRRRSLDRLRTLLLLATLVISYLNLGIPLGGYYFSGAVTVIFGSALLCVHLFFVRSSQALVVASRFAICSLAWAATIPFSPDLYGFFAEHLKSLVMLTASTLAAVGVYLEIRTVSAPKLEKAALRIFLALLIMGLLESYTPLRIVSDAFRENVYKGAFIYDSDARDLAISHAVRPKVFTQEPSHYAKALALSLACWVILNRSKNALLLGAGAWLVALFVTGSPTTLLAGGAVALERVFRNPPSYVGFARYATRFAMVTAPILLLATIQTVASFVPNARMQEIASGEDNSSVTRTLAPPYIAYETAVKYPIAGAAIGGRELVQDVLVDVYSTYPNYDLKLLNEGEGYVGWANAFFEIAVYGGLLFTVIIMALTFWAFRQIYPSALFSFGCFFVIFNFDSGFASPRPWVNFMILMAVSWVRYQRDRSTTDPRRRRRPRAGPGGRPRGMRPVGFVENDIPRQATGDRPSESFR